MFYKTCAHVDFAYRKSKKKQTAKFLYSFLINIFRDFLIFLRCC